MKKILTCIPYTATIDWRVIHAINTQQYNKERYLFQLFVLGNYGVDTARNVFARKALDEGWDYVLQIDSDTIIPQGFFEKIIFAAEVGKLPIVSGWYYMRQSFPNLTTHIVPLDNISNEGKLKTLDTKDDTPMEVACAAMGCCLIETKSVFTKLEEPFVFKIGGSSCDMHFFLNYAKEIKKYVIPSLKCGHIAEIIL
jgi:hypothetical protein